MRKPTHVLYWEDVGERLIYAQLDDFAWKLPEKVFGYAKKSSLYIYHDNKLAAYYDPTDCEKEADLGYAFYRVAENVERIIALKKEIAHKVNEYAISLDEIVVAELSDHVLHERLIQTLALFGEALSTQYLTQPQFFERFEQDPKAHDAHAQTLARLAQARLSYTRGAWTRAMALCKPFFAEYAARNGLLSEEAESMTLEELQSGIFERKVLSQRARTYVLLSDHHAITVLTDPKTKDYIARYEQYEKIDEVKGVVGNQGLAEGPAFVVPNENLDLKHLPRGMKEGMVLIVQNAWPEFTPYYRLASAIVTNEGGITSHGVVVSREPPPPR
jgi:phosphoenolpyruvate synthase/pyruvate phosphate dikinase